MAALRASLPRPIAPAAEVFRATESRAGALATSSASASNAPRYLARNG
jgi:hypothetical protein